MNMEKPTRVIEIDAGYSYFRRWIINAAALLTGDVLVLFSALVLAGLIRYLIRSEHMPLSRGAYLIPAWCIGAIIGKLVPGWGMGTVEEMRRVQLLLLGIFALAVSALFFTKSADITSRIKVVLAYALCVPLLPLVRYCIRSVLIRFHLWGIPTVIYGTNRTASHVIEVIRTKPELGYIPVGVFEDESDDASHRLERLPVLGSMCDYTTKAPFAIIGVPAISAADMRQLLNGSLARYRRVILIPDLLDIPSVWVTTHDFNGVLGLEIVRNLLNPVARWSKSIFEWIAVFGTLPLWLPLCICIALAIWLEDRHNPFFMQERVGKNGHVFKIIKFRSMDPHAEAILEKHLAEHPDARAEWLKNCKLRQDPRITRMGRIVRITSLDELPQLFNVLKGDMALVGPRPLPQYHHEKLPANALVLRERVLPGITGLWQISGRSDSGTDGMEKNDSYYVRNWSIWLDITILAQTLAAVLRGRGAY